MPPLRFARLTLLLVCACTVRTPPGNDGDDSGAATDTSTGPGDPTTGVSNSGVEPTTGAPMPGTTTDPGTSTGGPGGTTPDTGDSAATCGFVHCGDTASTGEPTPCDGLKQLEPECAAGQKCTVDGDVSRTQCVDIVPAPKGLYEPCTVVGPPLSGDDDCGLGMLCWNADEQGHGICVGLCNSDDGGNSITCVDPTSSCSICQACAVGVCLPSCDPLLGECSAGNVCVFTGPGFSCVLDGSGDGGQVHDPCEFINACDDGLACIPPGAAVECDPMSGGCCQPHCDLTLPNPCTGAGQICSPWHEPGQAPPGEEHIGVCALP